MKLTRIWLYNINEYINFNIPVISKVFHVKSTIICLFVCFPAVTTLWFYLFFFHSPVGGFSLLVFQGFLITHNDAPQSVGLLWTSDHSVAETSTWQHTTLTTDKHPRHRWDSNPQSHQASGQRPTPKTARQLGPELFCLLSVIIDRVFIFVSILMR